MRIEACTPLGRSIVLVWHCEQCRKVLCKWVDTDTNIYAEYKHNGELDLVQAKKIVLDDAVVYINPTEPGELEEDETWTHLELVQP